MYKSIIAENIKGIISKKFRSKGAIARKAGYDTNKFSNMIHGRKIITDVDVMNIANALEVEPNELYGISSQESKTVSYTHLDVYKRQVRRKKNDKVSDCKIYEKRVQ